LRVGLSVHSPYRRVGRNYRSAVRPTRYHYGDHRFQVGDLWLPRGGPHRAVPVIVLIHGGYWRWLYTKGLMNRLARAAVARGWAVWNIEYRRLGALGGGGGWPSTFADVSSAVDYAAQLPRVDPARLITCGHSAGGCLALWAAAGSEARRGAAGPQPVVSPIAAVSLAGVVDLERGEQLGLGNGAVSLLLRGSPEQRPEAYRGGSPAALLPMGVPQVLVHGLSDTVVPPSMSDEYQKKATELGDDAVYEPLENLGHRDLIDPKQPSWPVIAGHIERLFPM
jgi:acetyl esterase/lipase